MSHARRKLFHICAWGTFALGASFSPLPTFAGSINGGSTVLVADFDGDGSVDVLALTKQGDAMLCSGQSFASCRSVTVPQGRAYFALTGGLGFADELLVLSDAPTPNVCQLVGSTFGSSCGPHLPANVGEFSGKGTTGALVFDAPTGSNACEWVDSVLSCRSTSSKPLVSDGTRYVAGAMSKVGAAEVLLVNSRGSTLCSLDVGTTSSHCSSVEDAGSRLANAVDIQVAGLLKGDVQVCFFYTKALQASVGWIARRQARPSVVTQSVPYQQV